MSMPRERGERERVRERAQRKEARDTKFENQIYAINKRASRESRRRDKFQEEARLLPQSHSQSQLLPLFRCPFSCHCSCHWATRSTTRRFNNILPRFVFFFSSVSCWALQHLPLDILFRPKLLPPLAARCNHTHTHTHV